jgi:RimJ/RimL family protein N-acetyltransferase
MFGLSHVALVRATDDHFAFLLGEQHSTAQLSLPPGGVDSPQILRMLRRMLARLHDAGCKGSWLILDGDEVVGLCGYKRPPGDVRTVEIGYGIAPERRNHGYATKAVNLLVEEVRSDQAVEKIVAETAVDNPASKIVLQRNGFTYIGTREDVENGHLDLWKLDL